LDEHRYRYEKGDDVACDGNRCGGLTELAAKNEGVMMSPLHSKLGS
jgi:hypothetical protein